MKHHPIKPALIEKSPGVWHDPDAAPSDKELIREHYRDRAIQILDSDKPHYERLRKVLPDKDPGALEMEFDLCVSVGGGHPKLESLLNVERVRVIDGQANDYKSLHVEYQSRYGSKLRVTYQQRWLAPERLFPAKSKSPDLVTFVHFLEHQTPEEITGYLNACADARVRSIIVYGPNIAKAKDLDWIHFRPQDHRTFLTLEAIRELMQFAGYSVESAFEFSDDYWVRGCVNDKRSHATEE